MDRLRARVWYKAVELASGAGTPHALGKLVESLQGFANAPALRNWARYKNGSSCPERGKTPVCVVDLVESHFPGTALYFESPIWEILKGWCYSIDEIDEFLVHALGKEVREVLFDDPSSNGVGLAKDVDFAVTRQLIAIRSFEAFVSTVLLVTKSEAIANVPAREAARRGYIDFQEEMDAHPVVGSFSAEIYWYADRACPMWRFPTNQRRHVLVEFTHRANIKAAFELVRAMGMAWPVNDRKGQDRQAAELRE